ncbi:type 1 glutamine amidotransferase [Rhodobacter maris]|uniref:GMP synthase-like glutamine amidotransferase n=1 Tax=Rhodobacter maris TaxID=446682 RepID=A0A285TAZ6_9RHOB|nr:type 1 glutamine amidotransferase [Rhodobacter maris]SOC18740.1 GMP synthase-like glutamine amidotransferase [Rhodobacter maris]
MRIGILQTGQSPEPLREEAGDYPDMFTALLAHPELSFQRYDVEHMQFPADVHDCDGWLITGSRHGAYEDHAFIPPLEDFIRKAIEAGVPMVGICFGHQIIAQAMGGKVERYEGGWAVGPQTYDFEGEPVTLNAWHRDQVTRRPEGARVIACNDFCANAALVYGETALTIQAHPEFRDAFVEGLITTRGPGVVPDPLMAAAREKLGQGNDSGRIARRIADFFLTRG